MNIYQIKTDDPVPRDAIQFVEAKNASHAESIIKTEYGSYRKIEELVLLTNTNRILRDAN